MNTSNNIKIVLNSIVILLSVYLVLNFFYLDEKEVYARVHSEFTAISRNIYETYAAPTAEDVYLKFDTTNWDTGEGITTIYGSNLHLIRVSNTSNSMAPTFNSTAILIYQYNPKNIRVGDIVIVSNKNSLYDGAFVHRVVDINGTCYVTKGDNNPYADGCLSRDEINSKIVAIIYGEEKQ